MNTPDPGHERFDQAARAAHADALAHVHALQPRRDIARRASPAHWISPDDAPVLILQGGQDRTVPPVQSRDFAERLAKAGVEVDLIEFPEAGHGGPEFKSAETIAKIVAFFDRHLQGE